MLEAEFQRLLWHLDSVERPLQAAFERGLGEGFAVRDGLRKALVPPYSISGDDDEGFWFWKGYRFAVKTPKVEDPPEVPEHEYCWGDENWNW